MRPRPLSDSHRAPPVADRPLRPHPAASADLKLRAACSSIALSRELQRRGFSCAPAGEQHPLRHSLAALHMVRVPAPGYREPSRPSRRPLSLPAPSVSLAGVVGVRVAISRAKHLSRAGRGRFQGQGCPSETRAPRLTRAPCSKSSQH